MVPKSGARLPKVRFSLSDSQLATLIGSALQEHLGGTHRATKTIMAWTGVSDHTARAWLHGRKSPSGAHILALAANCPAVLSAILHVTGHDNAALEIDLAAIEAGLEEALAAVRRLRSQPT